MKLAKTQIKALAHKYNLNLIILFGSQATGQTHTESDIDIAFYPNQKVNEEKIYQELCKTYKREDIDVINLQTNHNILLRYQIAQTGISLFEQKRGTHSNFCFHAWREYLDFKHYFTYQSNLINKKLQELSLHG